jgi:hypothetical protein
LRSTRFLCAVAALALGAGCSSGSLTPPANSPAVAPAVAGAEPAAKADGNPESRLVFFANSKQNLVDIWRRTDNGLAGVLSYGLNHPVGLAADSADNLYIANRGDSDVLVYAPPYGKTPSNTLADKGNEPNGVVVAADGTVGVVNACTTAQTCPAKSGSIAFYAKGETSACATIPVPDYDSLVSGAFDSTGDFYFDGTINKKVVFSVISGGCSATAYNELTTDYTVKDPGSIQFGPHGYLYVIDPSNNAESIDSFSTAGGTLTKQSVTKLDAKTTINPTAFAFTGQAEAVFVVNTGGGSADKFEFPEGGDTKAQYSIGGKPSGVTVTPAFPL